VEIHVIQGEREMAGDNRTLGRFHLVGIPPAPRGIPQVEVAFDIDANGIVNVSAKDLGTGKEQQITITSSSGLSEDEINNMVKEADSHSEEDKQRREKIETRNQLDSLIYNTEKTVNENKEKLPSDDLQEIEDAIKDGKKALESEDMNTMKEASERITKASHKLAEVIYQQQSQEQAAGAQTSSEEAKTPEEEEVVDAEFEDEK
jgi:molecular chaperone DnaK